MNAMEETLQRLLVIKWVSYYTIFLNLRYHINVRKGYIT